MIRMDCIRNDSFVVEKLRLFFGPFTFIFTTTGIGSQLRFIHHLGNIYSIHTLGNGRERGSTSDSPYGAVPL